MTTELQAAIARLEYVSRDEQVPPGLAGGAKLSEDVAAVLTALSSPPADDVREALAAARNVEQYLDMLALHEDEDATIDDGYDGDGVIQSLAVSDLRTLVASAREVRLPGTVTEPTEADVEQMGAALVAAASGLPQHALRIGFEAAAAEEARSSAESTRPTNHVEWGSVMSDTTYAHALAELRALEPGSVVLDCDGDAWQLTPVGWTCVGYDGTNGRDMDASSVAILTPITIIHRAPSVQESEQTEESTT